MAEPSKKNTAPCGSWPSPITPELAAGAAGSLDYPVVDGDYLYWLESRPEENGRNTVMRMRRPAPGNAEPCRDTPRDTVREMLRSPLSVRSRVHEYGGKAFTVKDDVLYFVLQDDQCIYRLDTRVANALPEVLSPANQGLRFAELCVDSTRQRLIVVCEQHLAEGEEPENFIAAIPLNTDQTLHKLLTGADFYAYPCLNADGSRLAFISWRHPDMPWDNTRLEIAGFDADGAISSIEQPLAPWDKVEALGKKAKPESILQPKWAPDDGLFFVSDRSEWWNIYYLNAGATAQNGLACTSVSPMAAEFATPLWTLGMSNYDIADGNDDKSGTQCLITTYTQDGLWQLGYVTINPDTKSPTQHATLKTVATPYTQLSSVTAKGNRAWFIGSSPCHGSELVELDIATQEMAVLRQLGNPSLDAGHFSQPQTLLYPTTNSDTARGFYYPPTHPEYRSPKSETPPLIALCHGGPTGATSTALSYKIQFWTNRGFAIADFNYRGSTGFGRSYRNKLRGNWGRADVDDIVAGVEHLCERGLADPERLLIHGSSAGGYTVLAALAFTDIFRAGASLYGIGDLETLAQDTHKFEARYLDSLIGPYPEARQTYIERSPLHHTDKLNCPVIFFQGLDDRVVPANQALAMVDSLKAKGLEVVYVSFSGEGHGFRSAKNIARVFREELAFYQRVLGIPASL